GMRYILVIVDYYTKYVILHALRSKTAQAVEAALRVKLALRFGIPTVIVSDGGGEFTALKCEELLKEWKVEHRVSVPRHPQGNSQVERVMAELNRRLRAFEACNWSERLAELEWSLNT